MKRIIVQIYEIQEPRQAERLIEMGVDRIGSVILSPDMLKAPSVREVVRLVRGSGAKSSLIPCSRGKTTSSAHWTTISPISSISASGSRSIR